MRQQLSDYIDYAISFLLMAVAGLTPLLFFNQTTEFFEMPKLVFLVVATILLVGLWIFSWILKGKVTITRTPLDIPLLILLTIVILSTYFSTTRFAAIYGNFPTVHGSAVAWTSYILLYFVTVSHLKSLAKIRNFLYVLYGSAVVVSLVTLLSFFGLFLPFNFAQSVNFTPTGSSFSTIAFLLLLLPFPMLSLLNPNKYLPAPFALALSILFSVTIALTGAIPTYVALVIVYALSLFVSKPQQVRKTVGLFVIPVVITIVTLILAYLPFPGNVIQAREVNFPKEIQLPFSTSWKVSASAFRDAPFIGTGPSSYLFNFTSYKPAEFNLLPIWNLSFDKAYNEFLHILGTLGILGFLAFVLFGIVTFVTSWRNLSLANSESQEDHSHILAPALAVSGIISIILLAIHSTTLVSIVMSLFVLAALMLSQKSIRDRAMEFSIGIKAATAGNRQFDLLPVIFFVIFLVGAVPALVRLYNVVAGDFYHRQALSQANRSGSLTYQNLQRAETLNPRVDLYRVDMAQTNFALANAIASQKGPTAENPQGTLTDQDRQTIQTLLSQSVNEGRAAVALSPRSARNWEVLGAIYRNITGVAQNAFTFSLDAYGRAIQRDPLNPALRVSVGGIYYSIRNYDLAIRFFSDAANLKPDYANAYYNLSIALRDKGDLENARLVAEQTVNLLRKNPQSLDYQLATDYLTDLKARIATGSANQAGQTAPAGQTDSALGNQDLGEVDVADLDNPPTPATPSAVRRNPNANLPQPTAAPTRAPQR